jgi:hypothetical protein
MDSTRAELMGAYAVLHKMKEWEGTVGIWVDNDNVVRGLERRLGVERADAVWARAEDWTGSTMEEGGSWRVQPCFPLHSKNPTGLMNWNASV